MSTPILSYFTKEHEVVFFIRNREIAFVIGVIMLFILYRLLNPTITYEYEFLETEKHRIHIVKIQPDTYNEEFRIEGPIGMTIIELAEFMQKLNCSSAINLDGGGSSSLWVDTKLVNKQIGDTDEANGIEITRPISDAIIFK